MADTASTSEDTLEQQLDEMLEIEKFDPPEAFREHALLSDPAVYDEAGKDWKGWWTKQAKELDWFTEPTTDVNESNAPFYKWFEDGKINASYNCLDRHVEAGKGDKGKKFSWLEWRLSQDGKGSVTRDEFEKALMEAPRERFQTLEEDVNQCVDELTQLLQALNGKMGSAAPGLIDLRAAVEDCRKLIKQILAQKGGGEAEGGEGGTDGTGEGGVAGRLGSREQAYRQLAQAAALLRQLEPHSPIPYLIQRAVELGSMPFPQLIRALIREPNILSELNRELGIKEAGVPPPPSG